MINTQLPEINDNPPDWIARQHCAIQICKLTKKLNLSAAGSAKILGIKTEAFERLRDEVKYVNEVSYPATHLMNWLNNQIKN
jgi:hypothetical protein